MNDRIAALDFVSGCLRVDNQPKAINKLRSDITSERVAWEVIVSIANDHLVTPALWVALNDKGLVEYLPEDLREYLRELHRLNTQRNQHLKRQAMEAVRQLNYAGVEPVFLKGIAYLFTNTFSDLGARVMTDLDILVPEEKFAISLDALYALGYRADEEQIIRYAQSHHWAPLFCPGEYATIEIHRNLMSWRVSKILPTKMAWPHTEILQLEGLAVRVLSPTYRVMHSILHSQVQNGYYQSGIIDLRSLYDLASISITYRRSVDWIYIQKFMNHHGKTRILRSYVYLAHRFFGMTIPKEIKSTLGCIMYYIRTRALQRWFWMHHWDKRILRKFSADRICERYNYKDKPIWLMMGRVRYIGYLLSKHSNRAMKKLIRRQLI